MYDWLEIAQKEQLNEKIAESIEQDAIGFAFRTRAEAVERHLERRALLDVEERREAMDQWYDIVLNPTSAFQPGEYLHFSELEAVRRVMVKHEAGLSGAQSWSEILAQDLKQAEPIMNLIYRALVENWGDSEFKGQLDVLPTILPEDRGAMPIADRLFLSQMGGRMVRQRLAQSFNLPFPVTENALAEMTSIDTANLHQSLARIMDRAIDDIGPKEICRWFNK